MAIVKTTVALSVGWLLASAACKARDEAPEKVEGDQRTLYAEADYVCSGQRRTLRMHGSASPQKPGTAGLRPRPILLASVSRDQQDVGGSASYDIKAWAPLPAPASIAELELVACRTQEDVPVASCTYTNKSGATSTIKKYKLVDKVAVLQAATRQVLGTRTFEGGSPPDKCDDSVIVRPEHADPEILGTPPREADEIAFAKAFVEAR